MNGGFQSIGTGWASEPWNSASSYTAIESVRDARAYFSMETTTAQTTSLSMALGVCPEATFDSEALFALRVIVGSTDHGG